MERKDAEQVAALLKIHSANYSPESQSRIKGYIRSQIDLATDDQASDFGNNKTGAGQSVKKGQTGKTRTQPRQMGGRFGKKGKNNGEQAMGAPEIDPEQVIGTIQNLQIGQSVSLLGNNAKVKRLGRGYQIVRMDGSQNEVVKDLQSAVKWARGQMKGGKK